MAYALPFVKINAAGHFGSSATDKVEYWTAGFHLTKNGGVIGGTSELTGFLSAIKTATQSLHTSSSLSSGVNCFLDERNGAYIGTDGKYVLGSLQTTTRDTYTTPVPGIGAVGHSWADSCVFTLRSLLLRGPASHGRIYWPALALNTDGTKGVIPSATVISIRSAAATWINAINLAAAGAFGAGTNVGLVSPIGTGFQSPCVRVGVGQKIDHMESRERSIPESHNYGTLTLAAALLEDADDEFRRRFEQLMKDQALEDGRRP